MTEQEAKRKRCCGPHPCGEVPMGSDISDRYCIGSACMAWRFDLRSYDDAGCKINPGEGYCGLAGKP